MEYLSNENERLTSALVSAREEVQRLTAVVGSAAIATSASSSAVGAGGAGGMGGTGGGGGGGGQPVSMNVTLGAGGKTGVAAGAGARGYGY